tara:strand:- start:5438 stop:5845 length:408 start_codon:yes stop_codon:yes gene_type:complete
MTAFDQAWDLVKMPTSQEIKQHIENTHLDEDGMPDHYHWKPEWDDLHFTREETPMEAFSDYIADDGVWAWVNSRRLEDMMMGSHERTQFPPVVLAYNSQTGEYEIIDGYHRLNAKQIYGHDTADAYVGRILNDSI